MKQRTRTTIAVAVSGVVVAAVTTAGVVALRGGLEERRNAHVLAEPGNVMVPAKATVKSGTGTTEWKQMPVRFDTAEGKRVETMVWTRHPRIRFHSGDTVDIEYVSGHPAAARLVGQEGGPPDSDDTIFAGAAILAGMVFLMSAWVYGAAVKLRRRRPAGGPHRPATMRQGRDQ